MKKNTYFLLGIFLCLVIVAYLVLQKPGEQSASSAGAGPLFTVDSLLVEKIEIKSPASAVVLEKRGAEWFVAQPVSDRADQAAVGQIIHQIKNLEVKSSVSSKPEKHALFQVDQTGTQVTLFEKGAEQAAFILGKMAESYTASFVRKLHSDEVLLVEGASGYMFNRPVKEWRDKTVMTVPREGIKEIRYQYGDTTFAVSLIDSLWVVGKEKAQQPVVEGILSALTNIQADDFIDSAVTPKITAQVTYAGVQLRFSYMKEQNKYEIQSSNSPRWYVMEPWKANQLLKRKKEIVVR